MSTNWKRREYKLMNGYSDLASAVLRQWKIDGKPRGAMEGINVWANIVRAHQKHNEQQVYSYNCAIPY